MNLYQPKVVISTDEFYLDDATLKSQEFGWWNNKVKRTLSGHAESNRLWGMVTFVLQYPYHDLENERKLRKILNTKGYFYFYPNKIETSERYLVKVAPETHKAFYINDKYMGYIGDIRLIGYKDFYTPTFAVISPNGGETWNRGTLYPITWTTVNENVTIGYNSNSGVGMWSNLATGIDGNLGTWNWIISQPATTKARIRVVGSSVSDMSDADFTIQLPS